MKVSKDFSLAEFVPPAIYEHFAGIEMNTSGEEAQLRIYPNPVSEFFTIEIPGDSLSPSEIDFVNSAGQLIQHRKTSLSSVKFDATSLTPGMYYIRVSNQGKTWLGKLIR